MINSKIKLHLIEIELNKDDKPVLFGLAGMSHKSFIGTSKIIINKLESLKTKFSKVYLLEYASLTNDQNEACKNRDVVIQKFKSDYKKIYESDFPKNYYNKETLSKITFRRMYNPEHKMNLKIAHYINSIITKLKLTNVHLLGKCNGAWVVSQMLLMSNIYKGLYLAVPGIAIGVESLYNIKS